MEEFRPFQKIARLSREMIITEKIDGTNSQIFIKTLEGYPEQDPSCVAQKDGLAMFAGSRNRWLTLESDNFGFAAWAVKNQDQLFELGEGRHFGEWWGSGIQRGYGLKKGEKRFSLFNVKRWEMNAPACCHVVPVLYRGMFDTNAVFVTLSNLAFEGSRAAPGFMKPEGVVVYHVAGNIMFKKTIEKDDEPKGKQE